MSTVLLKTAFNQSKSSVSTNFKKFREFRSIIAHRLVESTIFSSLGDDKEGYPLGFGKNQQSVLLHSFVAAYSGSDPNRIELNPIKNTPLPNWNLKFTGLTEIKSIAKIFFANLLKITVLEPKPHPRSRTIFPLILFLYFFTILRKSGLELINFLLIISKCFFSLGSLSFNGFLKST